MQSALCVVLLVAPWVRTAEGLLSRGMNDYIGVPRVRPHVLLQMLSVVESLLAVTVRANVVLSTVRVVRVHVGRHVALPGELPMGHSRGERVLITS